MDNNNNSLAINIEDYMSVLSLVVIDEYGMEVIYATDIRSNYKPGDTDSIRNCIFDLSNKAERIKEINSAVKSIFGYAKANFRLQFIRPDKSIVDQVDIDNNELQTVIDIRNKFQLV